MQQSLPPLTQAYALFETGQVADALDIVQRHAAIGDPDALFTLGDMYWRGTAVAQDVARARDLVRASSEAGQPIGARAYTNLLANGVGGDRDWPEAVRRLEMEARSDVLRKQMLDVVQAMDLTPSGDPIAIPAAERLSEDLNVRVFRGAFTPQECQFLMVMAEPTYQRSLIIMDGREVPDPIRTSDGSTIHWLIEDPATHAINRRLGALSGTAVERGEPLQILRYRSGQQYRPHFDWLPPPNRRILTALIYLNEDYGGGETDFPKIGLKVRGRKGDALVFESALANGDLDPRAEHCGLPVTSGTKYLASRWIREHRYTP
jgi:prolyl 4-hydroxylase